MIAVVDIAGQQFKLEKGQHLIVNRLDVEEGENVTFNKVLLLQDGSNIKIGNPILEGVSVNAKVIQHLKGDKVLVFKKKRRKGYRKLNGHRQRLTRIEIESIEQ